jgi:Sec-independent protein secretion pathway component TatC
MRAVLPMCVAAFFLFVAGALFGFLLLLPSTLEVTIQINRHLGWAFRWTVDSYYGILMQLVLGVGAIFQFPLVVVLLVWLGLASTATLRKYRRHSIVGIFVLAAIITPSGDPLQQTMLAAPLIGLYEIAIIVARRIEKIPRTQWRRGGACVARVAPAPASQRSFRPATFWPAKRVAPPLGAPEKEWAARLAHRCVRTTVADGP